MQPLRMTAFIGGKRYSTDKSTLLAHDAYWDGKSEDRDGKNEFLFRTEKGDYFVQHRVNTASCFDAAHDWVEPVTETDAVMLYWELPERPVEFERAFG